MMEGCEGEGGRRYGSCWDYSVWASILLLLWRHGGPPPWFLPSSSHLVSLTNSPFPITKLSEHGDLIIYSGLRGPGLLF